MTNQPLKKILYVENGIGYGGAIICLRHLVRNLDRSQYMPMVVTGRTSPQYREIANEALWKHIPDRHIDIVGAHQKLDPAIWPDKLPGLRFVLNQILSRTDDLVNFLPFFLQLFWTAWYFKADLIHANNEPLCNRAALLVAKILKIPAVCHVRGDQDGSRMMRWAFTLPDHFIPVSCWIADSIQRKLQIPAKKMTVVYDGLELDKLDINTDGTNFRKQHNIPETSFTVGLVGLLIPWKGQEIFIDAAKLLKNDIPNLKMLIVGGTPDDCVAYEKMLRERVVNEGLCDIVQFTGHSTRMPEVYNGLDIVVSASTSPEPLGTVVIEAMAMGRPLIGPNHGGAKEMIIHQQTGLLFTPGNPESLAAAIQQFHNNPELSQKISQTARSKALKTFAVEQHVNQVQSIYTPLL